MAVPQFAHVGLACKDMLITEKFYTKYFGFTRSRVVPLGKGEQIVFLKSQECGLCLELFSAPAESPIDPPDADGYGWPGYKHIAFSVNNVDDAIKQFGDDIKVTLGPADFSDFLQGWKGAWLADPDGRIIEIAEGYVDQENPPSIG